MTSDVVVDTQPLAQALDQAWHTIRRTIPRMGANRPEIGQPDLTYARSQRHFWVEGFWSGQLWLAYAATGDALLREAGRQQRAYFAERLTLTETHDHDMGFLYTLSAVADYKLTGDPAAREMGLAAAEALAARFNIAGQFIRAWNDWAHDPLDNRGRIIIDSLENLALLLWAAEESGQPHFYDVAVAHAGTCARYLIRADGSSYHTYTFDPASGAPLRGETNQGYADESCWSRGQAWGIHGFANVYAYTDVELFRESAQRLADYALAHLPPDGVPFWDYRLPADAPRHRDSSAAAITAAGLLLLADRLGDDQPCAQRYRQAALDILHSLIAGYTTADAPQAEGLLRHGAAHVPQGIVDTMLPYGDYFYVEALLRALGRREFFW
jgi:unsaturated chondroitin disaccharide hydrolase